VTDRFPPKRSGEELEAMVAAMGGESAVPRLVPCLVCGHPVWRNLVGAHAACLGGVRWSPDEPVRPAPVIGTVYGSISRDSRESQVSDRKAREIQARADALVAESPRCGVCARPMVAGQRGSHHSCKQSTDHDPNEGRMH